MFGFVLRMMTHQEQTKVADTAAARENSESRRVEGKKPVVEVSSREFVKPNRS